MNTDAKKRRSYAACEPDIKQFLNSPAGNPRISFSQKVMRDKRTYVAIDLKSFYASAECMARGLDPLSTNLVVADESRTEKTICLAVSPSLKAYGVSGRARLFEVVQKVKEINAARRQHAPGKTFSGESYLAPELENDASLALSYLIAQPRMSLYMQVSTKIHSVYLNYIAPEDIYVYSIDEVFIDVTSYLNTYKQSAHDLTMRMILDVLSETGITATAGIGPNLYLCKIAMDVMAKHVPADENGVRIAELDETSYRRQLWDHRPITDFWRVGPGYAKKLAGIGIHTMGDIALFSTTREGEDTLYRLFGVNAELLIDHAWGYEPCTLADIKSYKPEHNSLSSGQVLKEPYDTAHTRIIIREMAEMMALNLVDKRLVTDQLVLTIGYDIENLTDPDRRKSYRGEIVTDRYGRKIPKHSHGTENLGTYTSSGKILTDAALALSGRIINPALLVRRITLSAEHVVEEGSLPREPQPEQLDLFTDYEALEAERAAEEERLKKERRLQEAQIALKKKFGKNAVIKGTSLQEGATGMERNRQIGGHKA